jgi:anti-sigma regulatory factor (Ser/Thr protein kinase)
MIPPDSIDDATFDLILRRFNPPDPESIDLRKVEFIDPYGMVGILELGRFLSLQGRRLTLYLPESVDIIRYLSRMDFFRFAKDYFMMIPDPPVKVPRKFQSDVLLEITSIEKSDDIHFIVGRVKDRAHTILERHLHYTEKAINYFLVSLSEVCQNIIEHSENRGFVGIQKYFYKRLNRNVVKIAVMDLGIGFKRSLEERFSLRNDLDAIERALLHGASRYADIGRGHGLRAVRRFVKEWNGKISIRSGTARLSIVPPWSWGKERDIGLSSFPGAQISIVLPEV